MYAAEMKGKIKHKTKSQGEYNLSAPYNRNSNQAAEEGEDMGERKRKKDC